MEKTDAKLRSLLSEEEQESLDRDPLGYYLYRHKTKKCPHYHRHTEPTCPYYFYREGRRRHPVKFTYSWRPCKHVKKSGDDEDPQWDMPQSCPTGDGCPFAHSKVESVFHPARFKTELCKNWEQEACKAGFACTRAHGKSQLRNTEEAKKQLEQLRENQNNNDFRRRKPPLRSLRANSPNGIPHGSPTVSRSYHNNNNNTNGNGNDIHRPPSPQSYGYSRPIRRSPPDSPRRSSPPRRLRTFPGRLSPPRNPSPRGGHRYQSRTPQVRSIRNHSPEPSQDPNGYHNDYGNEYENGNPYGRRRLSWSPGRSSPRGDIPPRRMSARGPRTPAGGWSPTPAAGTRRDYSPPSSLPLHDDMNGPLPSRVMPPKHNIPPRVILPPQSYNELPPRRQYDYSPPPPRGHTPPIHHDMPRRHSPAPRPHSPPPRRHSPPRTITSQPLVQIPHFPPNASPITQNGVHPLSDASPFPVNGGPMFPPAGDRHLVGITVTSSAIPRQMNNPMSSPHAQVNGTPTLIIHNQTNGIVNSTSQLQPTAPNGIHMTPEGDWNPMSVLTDFSPRLPSASPREAGQILEASPVRHMLSNNNIESLPPRQELVGNETIDGFESKTPRDVNLSDEQSAANIATTPQRGRDAPTCLNHRGSPRDNNTPRGGYGGTRGSIRTPRKGTLDLDVKHFCMNYVSHGRCKRRTICPSAHPTYLRGKGYVAVVNAHSLPQRCRHHERGYCEIQSLGRCQFAHISKRNNNHHHHAADRQYHRPLNSSPRVKQSSITPNGAAVNTQSSSSSPSSGSSTSTPRGGGPLKQPNPAPKPNTPSASAQPRPKRPQIPPVTVKAATRPPPSLVVNSGPVLKNSFSLLTTLKSNSNPPSPTESVEGRGEGSSSSDDGEGEEDDDSNGDGDGGPESGDGGPECEEDGGPEFGDGNQVGDSNSNSDGSGEDHREEVVVMDGTKEGTEVNCERPSYHQQRQQSGPRRESPRFNSSHRIVKAPYNNSTTGGDYQTTTTTSAGQRRRKLFKCPPCGVVCNAETQLRQHLSSNRHKMMLEEAEANNVHISSPPSYAGKSTQPPRLASRQPTNPPRRGGPRVLPSRAPAGYQYRAVPKSTGRYRRTSSQRK